MNALKKITTRAKQLQKKHPSTAWKTLVKRAGLEYRQGKLGKSEPRVKSRQTGSSNTKRDKLRKALAPGKRTTAHGTTYTERRKNRSDKPGTLTGVSLASLKAAAKKKINDQIDKLVVKKFREAKKRARVKIQRQITEAKAQLRKFS